MAVGKDRWIHREHQYELSDKRRRKRIGGAARMLEELLSKVQDSDL